MLDETYKKAPVGHSVCECFVCTLSGTSIAVMSHCGIHHECARREPIVFSVWQDDIILYLDVTAFIAGRRCFCMCYLCIDATWCGDASVSEVCIKNCGTTASNFLSKRMQTWRYAISEG